MKVNIVSPPCIINNNEDIIVSFGEMMATRVDGNHYRVLGELYAGLQKYFFPRNEVADAGFQYEL
ncbi:hypothetical protein AB6U14_15780 [Klebsiella pneumoniae]